MKLTVRDLVYVGLFGALWGALEIGFGSYLHVLKVPFSGTIMAAVGITIALVGRSFVAKRGSVLFIGAVTALLKMFSLGGIILNPMIGILFESGLAELGLLSSPRLRRASFVLAGALAVSWDFFHQFFTQGILAGRGILTVYGWTLEQGSRMLGIDQGAAFALLVLLLGLRLVLGAAAGFFAWSLVGAVRRRMGAEVAEARW
ncbi:MAG: hypothetical protein ACYC66_04975 [Chloroflexota bacterium]